MLRFSRKLAIVQIASLTLLLLAIVATTLWISREYDRLAESGTRRMIAGGIAALEEKLRTTTLDYSYWDDAYENIRARNMPWIWSNIGSGAAETGTTDLMIVIEPGGAREYGWATGMGEVPSSALLPAATIRSMLRLLDDVPAESHEVMTRFVRVGKDFWLLAVTRVSPFDGLPVGITDADLPRHLFGFRMDAARMAAVGAQFLIGDLAIAPAPQPGLTSLPLGGEGGEGGYAVWTQPRPGWAVLQAIAPPLLFAFCVIALASAALSRHVVASARHLERAVEAARDANRAKTEFLANVSHELRTPMNGIVGMTQIMQNMELDPSLRRMVDIVAVSGRTQTVLIEKLLQVAQIDSGTRELEHEPFDPVTTLKEVCDIVALKADAKGLALTVSVPPERTTRVLGDEGCLRQVLTNLLGNAVKFTNEGEVSASIALQPRRDGVRLRIEVADTGPGIDPKDHKLIFERFGMGGGPGRSAGGIGLGLSISKSLVELMGGTLALDSAPGKGARFTFDIPFELAAQAGKDRAAA